MKAISTFLCLLACLGFVSKVFAESELEQKDDIRFVMAEEMKGAGFPFSNAVEVDGWLLLSGSMGFVPGKGLVPGGIEPETRKTMDNIKSLLAAEGLGMERIVKCTVMLADMDEWPVFNQIYKEYFSENYPARSAFGVKELALGGRVEIECIARR